MPSIVGARTLIVTLLVQGPSEPAILGEAVARCGCSGTCSCSFQAGPGITLAGTGSTSDPVIISATGAAIDCDDVRPCLSEGPGIDYDPVTGVITARLSTDAGNATIIGTDGGIYSPSSGGGGGLTAVTTTDTPCVDFSGLGTAGSPLTAVPRIDPAAGNLVACTPTGLRAALTTGACGLTGNGSAASPLAARVQAWPYPCPVDTQAGGVYCDSTGTLRSDPPSRAYFEQDTVNTSYANLAVPAGFDNLIETRSLTVDNPDPCRPAFVIMEYELDVDFILPAGGGAAAYGIAGDEMAYFRNSGSSQSNDIHVQTTKVFDNNPIIPPGGSFVATLDVTLGRGAGGATYNRIQTFMRAFLWCL